MNREKAHDSSTLGGRMKHYEKIYEVEIPREEHIIIRLDGHKFSGFTKDLKKPFDAIFARAMIETTKDLLQRFTAVTGYTQSDEITLIIPSNSTNSSSHISSGRVQKLASLASSFCTVKFNKYFTELSENDLDYNYIPLKTSEAMFDCRVFGAPDDAEAFNTILWRNRDCVKNSRSMFSRGYCSHKELLNKTGQEQIDYTLETRGKDWYSIPEKYKYGTIVKKEQYIKKTQNGGAIRTRTVEISKELVFSQRNVDLVMKKYLEID